MNYVPLTSQPFLGPEPRTALTHWTVSGDGPASQNFVLIWKTPHQGARYGDVPRVSLSTVRTHYLTVNLGRGDKLSKTQRSVGATETKRKGNFLSRGLLSRHHAYFLEDVMLD